MSDETLNQLAQHYFESGYTAAFDGALYGPNGHQRRGLIKYQGEVYLPEQIGWKVRELIQSRARRNDSKRDLVGLVMHSAPQEIKG